MGSPHRRRRRFAPGVRLWLLTSLLTVLTLLTSCSALSSDEGAPPTPPWPTTSASVSATERPVVPVPDVRPDGFADPPPGVGLDRYASQPITWRACRNGQECAEVLVPLDYAKPDGTAITLAVARIRATGSRNLGSLFINPGGPGGSGVAYVGYFERAGLQDYDIVGWDPRGVGESTPVQCAGAEALDRYTAMDGSPDTAEERTAWIQANRAFGRSCLERSGPLLSHVSTVETVHDLDLLRRMLGDTTLSYFGSSYGTQIGAVYAELFPDSVGRMVLDGAVDITDDSDASQAEGFDKSLRAFAAWCAERGCSLGSSPAEVQKSVVELWQELDAKTFDVGRRQLTQQLAVTGVIFVLYENEKAWPALLRSLEDAIRRNNGGRLLAFADQYNQRRSDGQYGQFNYAFPAVRCLDSDEGGLTEADRDLAEAVEDAPTLGPFLGADYVCPMWPVPAAPDPGTLTGKGAAPIVVIGTAGDPATPYEYAVAMARQLESGVLVTFRGEGHLAYGQSPCVQRLVQAYLVDGAVPVDGSRC